jgi:hypothetical protein
MVFFSIFIVVGLLLVEPCVASITVPNNPETAPEIVSVKINSDHYWWPPSYSTDPYTGETTQVFSGKYVPIGSIEITIKNCPFTPYIDKDGHTINRYYTLFTRQGGGGDPERWWDIVLSWGPWYAVYQTDDDYTVVTVTYSNNLGSRPHFLTLYEGEVQAFRVQAVTGYFVHNGEDYDRNAVYYGVGSEPVFFEITIPVTTGTPKPTTTIFVPSTPSVPSTSDASNTVLSSQQLFTIVIIVIFTGVIVILLAIIAFQHKQRKNQTVAVQSNSLTLLFREMQR